jgi:predicted MFS family arabinose efflux permease
MFLWLSLARGFGIGTVASDVVGWPWFFCAALVGPIAMVARFSESDADPNCGNAIAKAPIPTSRLCKREINEAVLFDAGAAR